MYFFNIEILRLAKAGCRRRLPTFSGSQAQLTCFQGGVWAPRRGQGKGGGGGGKSRPDFAPGDRVPSPSPSPSSAVQTMCFLHPFPLSLSLFVTFLQRLSRDSPLAPHFEMYYPIQNIERTIRIGGEGGISCIISLCFQKKNTFSLGFFCEGGGLVTACFSRI